MRIFKLSLVICLLALATAASAEDPVPISELHFNDDMGAPLLLDQVVTIQGVVTVPSGVFNSSRTEVFIQDETGGMNLFNYNPIATYNLGDEVKVTGTILAYKGFTELEPIEVELIGTNRPLPAPLVMTCSELYNSYNFEDNSEPNESRLIQLNGVTWDPGNYALMDDTGTAMMYIDPDTGIPWPEGEFNVVGVLKQYDDAGEEGPWYLGYEVLPRFVSDITYGSGAQFVTLPVQTDVAMGGATIAWETDIETETVLQYGTTMDFELPPIELGNSTTDHEAVLTGLESATVYYCRAVAGDEEFPVYSPVVTIIAPSEQSSGEVEVYFSQSVDTSYSTGVDAVQTNIADRMIERIAAATSTIDFCFFGFTRDDVAQALVDAHNRGVEVRVIYEIFDPVINVLENAGIEVRTDPDEEHENTHNKFAIFDARDDDETTSVVWTGSWNASYSATNDNAENAVVVYDAALATTYTIEFEEMWGGAFSYHKDDNTPHLFIVGGRRVEQYMSPTDGLDTVMVDLIGTGDTDVFFAIYGFTDSVISDALVDRIDAGVAVRGVFDAEGAAYEYSEYPVLEEAGADVVTDNVEQGGDDEILHHKYLMADPLPGGSDPTIVTGSYNWTFTAKTYKDENILIFHDATIANIFFQEWMARYKEAGGAWDIEMPSTGGAIFIPAGAAVAGTGGSYWSTDVEINNRGDEALTYSIDLLERGADNSTPDQAGPFTLEPGQSTRYANIFGDLFGFEGAGALAFNVDRPEDAVITSRTFNAFDDGTLAGTFGQGIPAVRTSELIGTNSTVRLVGLSEDSDFRTNIGFLNGTDGDIRIFVEFFLADGSSLGGSFVDLGPYSNTQWNRAFKKVTTDAVADGYVDVWSENGRFAVYASVVGNDDFNDPTTVMPRKTPFPGSPVYIPAGAAVAGAGGSYWSTDVEVANRGDDPLLYTISLLERGQDNSSPSQVGPFSLDGGMSARYSNIFGDAFGFEGAGALAFEIGDPDAALLTSRTFNAFDNGTLAGTFGQGIPALAEAELIGADERVRLIGLAEDGNFRTNIGFLNGTEGAIRVQVEFFLADGTSLGQANADLAPYSNIQWNRAFKKVTGDAVADGYVDVWTDDGAFAVYASVVGNDDFNDPTTVMPQ